MNKEEKSEEAIRKKQAVSTLPDEGGTVMDSPQRVWACWTPRGEADFIYRCVEGDRRRGEVPVEVRTEASERGRWLRRSAEVRKPNTWLLTVRCCVEIGLRIIFIRYKKFNNLNEPSFRISASLLGSRLKVRSATGLARPPSRPVRGLRRGCN